MIRDSFDGNKKPKATRDPFQIEVGLVFGGDLQSDGPIEILRFVTESRFDVSARWLSTYEGLESVNWKSYGLINQVKWDSKGSCSCLIHLASTNVQFQRGKGAVFMMKRYLMKSAAKKR